VTLAALRPGAVIGTLQELTPEVMVCTFSVGRSLHPEIQDDGDADEKGETVLKRDGLHGLPPETGNERPYHLSLRHVLNVGPMRGKTLEMGWRFS
jgi:hypothetical protein